MVEISQIRRHLRRKEAASSQEEASPFSEVAKTSAAERMATVLFQRLLHEGSVEFVPADAGVISKDHPNFDKDGHYVCWLPISSLGASLPQSTLIALIGGGSELMITMTRHMLRSNEPFLVFRDFSRPDGRDGLRLGLVLPTRYIDEQNIPHNEVETHLKQQMQTYLDENKRPFSAKWYVNAALNPGRA